VCDQLSYNRKKNFKRSKRKEKIYLRLKKRREIGEKETRKDGNKCLIL